MLNEKNDDYYIFHSNLSASSGLSVGPSFLPSLPPSLSSFSHKYLLILYYVPRGVLGMGNTGKLPALANRQSVGQANKNKKTSI